MREQLNFTQVYLALAAALPINPPGTFVKEIVLLANRNPTSHVYVRADGVLCVAGDEGFYDGPVHHPVVGGDEWRPQIWNTDTIMALTEACYRYGIPGIQT